jgi:hypothetical protein
VRNMKDDQEDYYARKMRKAEETSFLFIKIAGIVLGVSLVVAFFQWLTG